MLYMLLCKVPQVSEISLPVSSPANVLEKQIDSTNGDQWLAHFQRAISETSANTTCEMVLDIPTPSQYQVDICIELVEVHTYMARLG